MRASKFTYDRSVTDDMADVLASVRSNCWSQPQLVVLDLIIREFMNVAHEHGSDFDTERFAERARYAMDRAPLARTDPTTDS